MLNLKEQLRIQIVAHLLLQYPKASALHDRISTALFHSGAKYKDLVKLNPLGVCLRASRNPIELIVRNTFQRTTQS